MTGDGPWPDDLVEALAVAYHDQYRDHAGADDPVGALTWAELPDELRESNRASVRELHAGLAEWGYRIRPLRAVGREHRAGVTELPAELVQELARAEHDRWARDAQAQGYVLGPERDDDRVPPTHPDLVGWQELDDHDRAKDNIRFATAPHLLARLGYEILAPDDPG